MTEEGTFSDIADTLGITPEPAAPVAGEPAAPTEGEPAPPTETPASSSEGTEGENPLVESDAQPKPAAKTGAEKRIAELTWQRHETERQLAAEKARADTLEKIARGELAPNGQPLSPAAQSDPEPDPNAYTGANGKDALQYQRDLIAWNVRQVQKHEAEAREVQAREAQAAKAHQERQAYVAQETGKIVSAGLAAYADFQSTVGPIAALLDHPAAKDMTEALIGDEYAADALYYLGKKPSEAARIAGLLPAQQVREMTRLLDSIKATRSKPKTSNAPPPIAPVGGASLQPPAKDPSKMTDAEYYDWRAKQRAAQQAKRK